MSTTRIPSRNAFAFRQLLKEDAHLLNHQERWPDRDRFFLVGTGFRIPLLDHFPGGVAVVAPPDDLVEVALDMLATEVVVSPEQGRLHVESNGLGTFTQLDQRLRAAPSQYHTFLNRDVEVAPSALIIVDFIQPEQTRRTTAVRQPFWAVEPEEHKENPAYVFRMILKIRTK